MGLEFTITLTCIYCIYTINTALYIQIRHTIQIQNGITSLTVLEILCFHFPFIFHSLHFPVPFYFMFPLAQLCFTSCHCFGNTHNNHHQLARNHPAITTVIFRVPASSVCEPRETSPIPLVQLPSTTTSFHLRLSQCSFFHIPRYFSIFFCDFSPTFPLSPRINYHVQHRICC